MNSYKKICNAISDGDFVVIRMPFNDVSFGLDCDVMWAIEIMFEIRVQDEHIDLIMFESEFEMNTTT